MNHHPERQVHHIENKENNMSELQLDFVHIPASTFTMGSNRSRDPKSHADEMPAQLLNVTDYFIMRFPVTNAQYAQFMQETGHRAPLFWKDGKFPEGKADHPVVGVSYYDAIAFCAWAGQVTGLPIPPADRAGMGESRPRTRTAPVFVG
jgi:formylglycine-generating enzyme required for sulfatase activity